MAFTPYSLARPHAMSVVWTLRSVSCRLKRLVAWCQEVTARWERGEDIEGLLP
jgi:hypothetical protein